LTVPTPSARTRTIRDLFEQSRDGIFMTDLDGGFVDFNQAAVELAGYTRDEFALLNALDLYAEPGDRDRFRAAIESEGTVRDFEVTLKRKDGSTLDVLFSATVRRNESGETIGYQGIVHDITDRKRVHEEIIRSEARFRSLIENASEIVSILDAEGRYRYQSPSSDRIIGHPSGRLIGRSVFELIHPEDAPTVQERFTYALSHPGKPVSYELRFRHGEGGWVHLAGVGVNLLADPAVEGIVTNSRDVTDQVAARQQLDVYTRELERSNRELQEFAHIASHDLQEPLRKIQAFGDRLEQQYRGELGERGADYLARMRSAAGRMQVLINDLLTLSRIATQAKPFVAVALDDVVADVANDLSDQIDRAGGKVEVGPLPEIEGDPFQIRQLFQNLISNALKFRRDGVPPVVSIEARGIEQDMAEIAMRDNGIGFEAEFGDRIFRPFERLHARSEYEGTGMGLAICRRIAERHHGSIEADSTLGEGTTFIIQLPVRHQLDRRS
jgi:two-component system, LuxR family, sensor kinase FixL